MQKRNERNARFWEFILGSPVKITLRPGQELKWHTGYPTEEGYHYESHTWFYDDATEVIHDFSDNGGSDCDGRIDYSSEVQCGLCDLQNGRCQYVDTIYNPQADQWEEVRDESIRYPAWEKVSRAMTDHEAIKAGY